MMTFVKNHLILFAGILAGAAGGWLWYRAAECPGGTCLITSDPMITIIYGAFMGGLLGSMFKKTPGKEK